MLTHKQRLFILGLLMIGVLGYNALAVHAVIPLIVIGVVMLGCFIAGAIAGYYVAKLNSITVYESGADLGNYIKNVGLTFESNLNNTRISLTNDNTMLNAMLRYYWSRKAECIAQYYINETTFPEETVKQLSGILNEYLNFTNAKADSLDNLLAVLNDFMDSTLVNFATLDVTLKSNSTNTSVYSLKDKQYLGLYQYNTTETAIPASGTMLRVNIGTFYYDNVLFSKWSTKNALVAGAYDTTGINYTYFLEVYDKDNSLAYNVSSVTYQCGASYQHVSQIALTALNNLTHGERYTIKICAIFDGTTANAKVQYYLPMFFTPANNTEIQSFAICSNYEVTNSTTSTFLTTAPLVKYLTWKNSTTEQELTYLGDITEFKAVYQTLTSRMETAMSSAQSYWSFLRALGYDNYTEIPPNFIIPTPSMVYIDSDVTDNLDFRQLNALYYAYMKSYADIVTSENYRTVNVSATDIKLSDLSLTFNCSAYNTYGNVSYWSAKYAFLMPTTANLVLQVGQNNTLTQTVRAFVFSTFNDTTGDIYELHANEKVDVHGVYREDVQWNITTTTILIKNIGQLAYTYDFTIGGDPTYTEISSYGWIAGIITVVVIMSVVMSVMEKRKRK